VRGSHWGKKTLTVKFGGLGKWSRFQSSATINGRVEVLAIFIRSTFILVVDNLSLG
jgi:hypothetical protein